MAKKRFHTYEPEPMNTAVAVVEETAAPIAEPVVEKVPAPLRVEKAAPVKLTLLRFKLTVPWTIFHDRTTGITYSSDQIYEAVPNEFLLQSLAENKEKAVILRKPIYRV